MLSGAALMNPNPLAAPSKVTSLLVRVTFFGPLLLGDVASSTGDRRDLPSSSAIVVGGGVVDAVSGRRNFGAMTSKFTGRDAPKAERFLEELVDESEMDFVDVDEGVEEEVGGGGAGPIKGSLTKLLGLGELITASADRDIFSV